MDNTAPCREHNFTLPLVTKRHQIIEVVLAVLCTKCGQALRTINAVNEALSEKEREAVNA